jgi:hypothetical protein
MSRDVRSKRMPDGQCEIDFQLELSRGASWISSCQTEASLRSLVRETLLGFLETHGAERFPAFRASLADRLTARGRIDAAAIILSYPWPTETAGPLPPSAPPGRSGSKKTNRESRRHPW